MFLNIQIDLIILKTYDQQFTLMTKKSLHIIFITGHALSINISASNFWGSDTWEAICIWHLLAENKAGCEVTEPAADVA